MTISIKWNSIKWSFASLFNIAGKLNNLWAFELEYVCLLNFSEKWFFVCSTRIAQTKMLTIELPNVWNFSFNFYLVVILVMLSYIPVFPQLYLHMFGQRKKILGNDSKKKAA